MVHHPIIPKCDISSLPPPSDRSVRLLCEAILQEFQGSVRFGFGDTYDPGNESRVDEYCFPAGDWVDSDHWVDRLDRFSSWDLDFADSGQGLVESGVHGVQGLEVCLVGFRQG